MPSTNRQLRVFLCHASQDKSIVRELYQRLLAEGWIDPWLDKEKLLPGQDWPVEIEKAVEYADAIIVFLSNNSVTKEGVFQREIKRALDKADEKPEGVIYIIPLRIENCEPPRRFKNIHYEDYFGDLDLAYGRLTVSLERRAETVGIDIVAIKEDLRRVLDEKIRKEREDEIRREASARIWREQEAAIRKQAEEHARRALKRNLKKEAEEKTRIAAEKREKLKQKKLELQRAEEETLREAEARKQALLIARRKARKQIKTKISAMEEAAFQYEIKGNWQKALNLYYEIRKINPKLPDVEVKIDQLEKDVARTKRKKIGEVATSELQRIASSGVPVTEFQRTELDEFANNVVLYYFSTLVLSGLIFFVSSVWIGIEYGITKGVIFFFVSGFCTILVILSGMLLVGPFVYGKYALNLIVLFLQRLQIDPGLSFNIPAWFPSGMAGVNVALSQIIYWDGYVIVICSSLIAIGTIFFIIRKTTLNNDEPPNPS